MGRPKGTPKTGGRKAGTPNKTTTDMKIWVANILDGGRDDFARRLANLSDMDYIRTYTGLLGYVMPKLSPSNPDDILRKEKEMMAEIMLSMPDVFIDRLARRLHELQKKENDEDKIK